MDQKPLRNADGLTEAEFLAAYRPGNWPHPAVTVDMAVLSLCGTKPEILLVRRGNHPWLGCWALPGGFTEPGESTAQAAARELREECNMEGLTLSEIGLFSAPGRDPRDWTMSDAFAAVIPPEKQYAVAGDDAAETGWFTVDWQYDGKIMDLTLTHKPEILHARVEIHPQEGAFGTEYLPGKFQTMDIACDHCQIIAQTILNLQNTGKL